MSTRVHDEIELKKRRHQQQQPKEQKRTNRREAHTQTQAQGETPQHSQSAFPPIPETRLRVSGHWRGAILPESPSSHLDAKESAVHCELHYFKFVKQHHTPSLTKVKAHPGPWPSNWFHYFQANAMSRQHQAAGSSSSRQQTAAGSSRNKGENMEKMNILQLRWIGTCRESEGRG